MESRNLILGIYCFLVSTSTGHEVFNPVADSVINHYKFDWEKNFPESNSSEHFNTSIIISLFLKLKPILI